MTFRHTLAVLITLVAPATQMAPLRAQTPAIRVSAPTVARTVNPGAVDTLPFTVTNVGPATVTIRQYLQSCPRGTAIITCWLLQPQTAADTLPPNASRVVRVVYSTDTIAGRFSVSLAATTTAGTWESTDSTAVTVAQPWTIVSVTPDGLDEAPNYTPGSWARIPFSVLLKSNIVPPAAGRILRANVYAHWNYGNDGGALASYFELPGGVWTSPINVTFLRGDTLKTLTTVAYMSALDNESTWQPYVGPGTITVRVATDTGFVRFYPGRGSNRAPVAGIQRPPGVAATVRSWSTDASTFDLAANWCDYDSRLDHASAQIIVDGVPQSSVAESILTPDPSCYDKYASTRAGIPVPPGTHLVVARICDKQGACARDSVTITSLQVVPVVTAAEQSRHVGPGRTDTVSFTLRNAGNESGSLALLPTCGGFATACRMLSSTTSMVLGGTTTATAKVEYAAAGQGASGMITLAASPVGHGGPTVSASTTIVLDVVPPIAFIVRAAGTSSTSSSTTGGNSWSTDASILPLEIHWCDSKSPLNPSSRHVLLDGAEITGRLLVRSAIGDPWATAQACYDAQLASTAVGDLSVTPGWHTVVTTICDNFAACARDSVSIQSLQLVPVLTAQVGSRRVAPQVRDTLAFTLRNAGNESGTIALSPVCPSAWGACIVLDGKQSVSLTVGGMDTVRVQYTSGGSASGAIGVKGQPVDHAGPAATATSLVSIANARPTIAITPATGTHYATNSFDATITWCDSADAIASTQVRLDGVLLPDSFVAQERVGCRSAGTSTYSGLHLRGLAQALTAQATDAGGQTATVSDTVWYDAPPSAFRPTVAPKGTSMEAAAGLTNTAVFTVTNAGTERAVYTLSPECLGATCSASRTALSLEPGASDTASIVFTLPAAATIRLAARMTTPTGLVAADTGSILASTSSYRTHGPILRPHANTVFIASNVATSIAIGLYNPDGSTGTASYTMRADCGTAYACSIPASAVAVTGVGPSIVPLSITASSGTGSAYLIAEVWGARTDYYTGLVWPELIYADTAVVRYTAYNHRSRVSPRDSSVQRPVAAAVADTFTVANTGSVSGTYNLAPTCGTYPGPCTVSPPSLTIAGGATGKAVVNYTTTGLAGSSSIQLIATPTDWPGYGIGPDTARLRVTTFDSLAPRFTVTPSQDSVVTSASIIATATVCDPDGQLGRLTASLGSTRLSPQWTATTQAGCTSAKTGAINLVARPGENDLTITATDGYHSASYARRFWYDPTVEVRPRIVADVQLSHPPLGVTWADSFTVANPAPYTGASYTLSGTCGGWANCVVSPAALTLRAGQSARVAVTYATPPAPAGTTIQLTATYADGPYTTAASATITAAATGGTIPTITFIPPNGSVVSSALLAPTVSWCDADDAIASRRVWLAGVLLADTYVAESRAGCASAGTSTWPALTLQPWTQSLVAEVADAAGHVVRRASQITYDAPLTAFAPQVTPKNDALSVVPGRSVSVLFTISNTGGYAAAYQLTPLCGGLGNCTAARTVASLAAGKSDTVTVSFNAPASMSMSATVRLVATYSSPLGGVLADTGSVVVSTKSFAALYLPSVTPVVATQVEEPGTNNLHQFTVKNTGGDTTTYRLGTTLTGGWFPPWTYADTLLKLAPGTSATVTRNAVTPADGNVGSVRLSATYARGSDTASASGSMTVMARRSTTSITLLPKDTAVSQWAEALGQLFEFEATNRGNTGIDVDVTVSCDGVVMACAPYPAWSSRHVDAGKIEPIDVYFEFGTSGSVGTLTIRARETDVWGTAQDAATIRIAVRGRRYIAASVSPASVAFSVAPSTVRTERFTIANVGNDSSAFVYRLSCDRVVVRCPVTTGTTAMLGPGDHAELAITDTSSAELGKAGTVALKATSLLDTTIVASGTVTLTTANVAGMQAVLGRTSAPAIMRNECLTIAVGEGAAYECGDLRLVEPLPATMTMNKLREPVLIYNGRHARAGLLVTADVAPQDVRTATIRATLHVDTSAVAVTRTFVWSPSWSADSARRIVIDATAGDLGLPTNSSNDYTGLYPYTLQLQAYGADSLPIGSPLTVSDWVIVIDRSTSSFGRGWWLDGLERLYDVRAHPELKLWVGGDGSARVYQHDDDPGSRYWTVRQPLDRPDTLERSDSTHWRRHLGAGAFVEFDNFLWHSATVNRLGQRTSFEHTSVLTAITLPVNGGMSRRYSFNYGEGITDATLLTSVAAPATSTDARLTRIGHQPGTRNVTTFTAPDANYSELRYSPIRYGLIVGRYDARRNYTSFAYDEARMLTSASVEMHDAWGNEAPPITRTFCPAESRGIATCTLMGSGVAQVGVPQAPAQVYTLVDGPRTDVGDTTKFYVNRWGAPETIIDALGHRTTIRRENAQFPALATSVVGPNGHEVRASYNDQGLIETTTDVDPNGEHCGSDACNAVTRYYWNRRLVVPDSVKSPRGVLTAFGYDTATGNRLWQQLGRDSVRRVKFSYHPAPLSLMASVRTPLTAADSIVYDGLGNAVAVRSPGGVWGYHWRDAIGRDSVVLSPIDTPYASKQVREEFRYDLVGHVVKHTASAPALTYSYDLLTPLPLTSSAEMAVDSTAYDASGNPIAALRWSVPDVAGAGTLTNRYVYDAASRRIVSIDVDGIHADSTIYDPAGNAVRVHTRRGYDVVMSYDALNRLKSRATPAVASPSYALWSWVFTVPALPSDVATFDYDAAGNMIEADNAYARVHRHFTPGGLLDEDELRVRTFAGGSFDQHVYDLTYTYNLDGERETMTHPASLRPADAMPQRWGYDGLGQLESIKDIHGRTSRLGYDAEGRPDTLERPSVGGILREIRRFDNEGRLFTREEYDGTTLLHRDTLRYDARGKVLTASTLEDFTGHGYTGLGALSGSARATNPRMAATWLERYASDALGHTKLKLTESVVGFTRTTDSVTYSYLAGTGRSSLSAGTATTYENSHYDDAGNRVWYQSATRGGIMTEAQASFYDAEERQRFAKHYGCMYKPAAPCDSQSIHIATDETIWYDALGRRVLLRSERGPCAQTDCVPYVQRFVWDGDALLYEIRRPLHEYAFDPDEEADTLPLVPRVATTGFIQRCYTSTGEPYTCSDSVRDSLPSNAQWYGRVIYTNGVDIDRPLDVIRLGYYSGTNTPIVIVPQTNWRGVYDGGVVLAGSPTIDWPGHRVESYYLDPGRNDPQPSWFGSFIHDSRDGSGLLYKRNRYYDPMTGRFTQEDPIGLGGGANLYGYAGGDPINGADPFGLTACYVGGDIKRFDTCMAGAARELDKPISLTVNGEYTLFGGEQPVYGPWKYGHWCGMGGQGLPISPTDAACMEHDRCYSESGFTAGSNYSSGGGPALQACNQRLCNAVRARRAALQRHASEVGPKLPFFARRTPRYSPQEYLEQHADGRINLYFTTMIAHWGHACR